MKKLSVLLLIVLLLVLTVNVLADDVTTKLNEDYGLTEEKLKQAELSTNKAKTKLYDELEEISKLEDKFMKPGEFAENLIEIDILTKDNLSNLDLAYKELLKSENKRLRKDFIEAPSWVKSKIKEILNEGESSKESTEWSDEELSALNEAVEQEKKETQQEKKETQRLKKR